MKYLLLLLGVFLFAACSSTSLLYQNDTITLQGSGKVLDLSGNTVYRSQQNLGKISIRQYLFKEKHNENLIYEYARIQTGYKLKYNYQYILRHVFDAKEVQLIKDENGLGFFTIELKEGDILNAIVKTGTKRSLTMLYGFSEENFKALISASTLKMQKPKETEAEEAIKSRWNMKLILFSTLLEQEGGRVPKRSAVQR